MSATIVWFRQDLRLSDNPALRAAVERGAPIVPVFIGDDEGEGRWPLGRAARGRLHHALAALDAALRERGLRLILRRGAAPAVLASLAKASEATAAYWNARYEPAALAREREVQEVLAAAGIETRRFHGVTLHEPGTISNRQGRPFRVFSAFWRECLTRHVERPVKLPAGPWVAPRRWPASGKIGDLDLRPSDGGALRGRGEADAGEAAALERLRGFVQQAMDRYAEERNLLGAEATSGLSSHLRFGEIGPRQVWAAVQEAGRSRGVFPPSRGASVFLNEIGWREFAYHLLFHFPDTPERPLRPEFARFPWAPDETGEKLRAWQQGQTGYPVVDAAMRQLAHSGWMHNRARMIVASFLVKHLRLPWQAGAAWFWEHLADADLANNTMGWQWSAGCSTEAAPYFRIFAPVLQGEKFDSDGHYVRRWLSELAQLPNEYLHAPWKTPADVLLRAGVRLGETYPQPIVDHATARAEALAAFRSLRSLERG